MVKNFHVHTFNTFFFLLFSSDLQGSARKPDAFNSSTNLKTLFPELSSSQPDANVKSLSEAF
jgi:hypothetical protein